MDSEQLPQRLIIGVTGGIGSGKSAATGFFSARGIDVIDADVVSREVVMPGSKALAEIAAHFGRQILLPDGSLNRKALRARIFSDPNEKQWLEALLHPIIRNEIARQLQLSRSPYVILSSPLLLETDQHIMTDRVLVLDTSEQQQIHRTSARDDTSASAVQAIMATQLSRAQRLQRGDDIIINDKDLAHLENEVNKLHEYYCELATCKEEKLP
jgi:dephospho-CoA kinase